MDLPPQLEGYRRATEQALHDAIARQKGPLYRLMEYQLGWVDDQGQPASPSDNRVRGVLSMASAAAMGGDPARASACAASVELVHNFAGVHDDIEDGSPVRGTRPSVWWLWGPAQAINAGDAMHALARLSVLRLLEAGWAPEAVMALVRSLDSAAMRLCEGQHQDLVYQERIDVSIAQYVAMTRGKTGALVGCAMELGARVAGADEATAKAFAEAGELLGLALQVHDDVADLWSPKTASTPEGMAAAVLNKSKSYPLAYALEKGTIKQKRELGAHYLKRVLEPDDVAAVLATLDSLKARDAALTAARDFASQAMARLRDLPLTEQGRAELATLATCVSEPDRAEAGA